MQVATIVRVIIFHEERTVSLKIGRLAAVILERMKIYAYKK